MVELVTCCACFWKATGAVFRAANANSMEENKKGGLQDALFKRPSARVTWLCSLFLLGYVGVEVALGGWIVTFMIRIRNGGAFASGMTATGFWLGITVGRIILGFVTPRVGEKLAIAVRTWSEALSCDLINCWSKNPPKRTTADVKLGIHLVVNGMRTCLMARTAVLRIRCGRISARVLPGTSIPWCRRDGHQAPPPTPACEFDRVLRCIW